MFLQAAAVQEIAACGCKQNAWIALKVAEVKLLYVRNAEG